MSNDAEKRDYRISELERKVKGLQQQVGVLHAVHDAEKKRVDRELRDLRIKTAVQRGAPQKEVAKIFEISAARVSQIIKKIA